MMRAAARFTGLLRRLRRDTCGVSAIEFAMLAPFMITLYFGCVAVSDGVAIDRKVSLTAAALANLSAQVTTISSDDMSNIFNASSAILAPYSPGPLTMTISCLEIDAQQNVSVKWSATQGGSRRTSFAFDSSNEALKVADTWLIYAEVSYSYTPVVGTSIVGTLNLSDHMFMTPRISPPSYNDGGNVEACKSP
jgi:Flp pilus assembly protein TadG